MPEDKHLRETEFFKVIDDPKMGHVRFTGVPVMFDGQRPDIKFPPRLGEHTREVLAEAGVSPADIEAIYQSNQSSEFRGRSRVNKASDRVILGHGFYWQDIKIGDRFKTFRRSITETDLVNFISVTGMLEPIFTDIDHGGAMGGRPVPAALTYAMIEGFLMRTMIHGTGMALLEVVTKVLAPVRVGDSIWATVEVTDLRPTSKGGRAVVTSNVAVYNQHSENVMTYDVKRLLAGAPS